MNSIEIPKVKIFIGNAKNINTGFINKFTSTIAIEAKNALKKLEICIPGIIQPVNSNATDKPNNFNKIANIITSFFILYLHILFCF